MRIWDTNEFAIDKRAIKKHPAPSLAECFYYGSVVFNRSCFQFFIGRRVLLENSRFQVEC